MAKHVIFAPFPIKNALFSSKMSSWRFDGKKGAYVKKGGKRKKYDRYFFIISPQKKVCPFFFLVRLMFHETVFAGDAEVSLTYCAVIPIGIVGE